MLTVLWLVCGVAFVALAWSGVHNIGRVRRLHRLHQRVDAARSGLAAALAARAAAARAAGLTVPEPGPDRQADANALGRRLAALDRAALQPAVRAELAEAEQLLVLARRVHNDAVRDTLGLRSRRLVRWLRLAGSAPMPAYFDIAEPDPGLTYDRVSSSEVK